MRERQSGFGRWEALALTVVLAIAGVLAVPLFSTARCKCGIPLGEPHGGRACRKNLTEIAQAAYQYLDDKRVTPHVGATEALDGGVESDTASRCMRALVYFNYLDSSEVLVCEDSLDTALPMSQATKRDPRRFSWGADPSDGVLPLGSGVGGDLPLLQSTVLSYGWTKRALTANSPPGSLLAGDKARRVGEDRAARTGHAGNMVGNHSEGMHVVALDCKPRLIKPDDEPDTRGPWIVSTAPKGGALGVLADDGSK